MTLRERIHSRDHGICALCGDNMDVLKETFLAARDSAIHCKDLPNKTDEFERLVADLQARGFRKCFTRKDGNGFWRIKNPLWEMDHLNPKTLGGDNSIENYRTACVPCHAGESKRLAKYRSRRKKLKLQHFDHSFVVDEPEGGES